MTSTQIQAFLKAAEHLSFTTAAEKLYISQPALSRSISALEQDLGLLLFVRRNNVLSLTPGGELLFQWLRKSKTSFESVLTKARQANAQETNSLRIGLIQSEILSEKGAAAIAHFQAKHSDVAVNIINHGTVPDAVLQLTEHNTDIALMVGTAIYGNPRLQYFEIGHYRRCVAVSILHPLAGRKTALLQEFANDVFISVDPVAFPSLSAMVRDTCSRAGFTPVINETSDITELISQVELNKGVALLFDHHTSRHNPLLRLIELEDVFVANLTCVWDRLNANPNIHTFIKLLSTEK